MTKQLYMFINDPVDSYYIESYTRYITTVESLRMICWLMTSFFDDTQLLDTFFQEIQSFSLTSPDENGNITVQITGIDWFDEVETIERGSDSCHNFYVRRNNMQEFKIYSTNKMVLDKLAHDFGMTLEYLGEDIGKGYVSDGKYLRVFVESSEIDQN